MADYTDLLPEILPHVIACPRPQVLQAIRTQATVFFEKSQAWTLEIDEPLVAEQATVAVTNLPTDTRIVVPLELTVDDQPLETTNHRTMKQKYGDYLDETATYPEFIFLKDHSLDTLVVVPQTTVSVYRLKGRIAIKPTRTATAIDDVILDEFADALVHGTLAKLLMVRNSEWYDPAAAQHYNREFEDAIEDAMERMRKQNTSRRYTTGYGGL